jgi:katanin p60 ATPase-containing subunit A1
MVQMQELLRGAGGDVISLAQGVVHWQPPEDGLTKVKSLVDEPTTSHYGADEGLPELRDALLEKLRRENKLCNSAVMVTAGANQAYVNVVLTLCDPGDKVVLFVPYYFNAFMAYQMTGVTDIVLGPSDSALHPDADWLDELLKSGDPPKVVSIVNPGNPSGTYVPEPLLKRISEMCRQAGCWLIVDNTYEYFMYDGCKHVCLEGDHILNIFSFSKAYGMMGWRVGYIAYPKGVTGMGAQLLKVQDNIPICASIIGQKLALAALEAGPEWVLEKVKRLGENRRILLNALSPLGEGAVKGGEGAIYLWAQLPKHAADDMAIVRWLVKKHGVSVIPGSASGGPGFIRISYGGLTEERCKLAAARLNQGLQDLVDHGMDSN